MCVSLYIQSWPKRSAPLVNMIKESSSSLSLLSQPFWIFPTKRMQRTLFCIRLNARMSILHVFTLWFEWKLLILALSPIQVISKMALCWREETERRYFYFLCVQKVFSSLYKIQIEPLIADCECVCVLCTDEGLMSYLQMYSTVVCYVLFRWDIASGGKLLQTKQL